MNIRRVSITNRHGLKLVIQVDAPDKPTNLAFIAHGQGGFMGQKHIVAFAEAFLKNNFRVVRFDATHALGESGGDIYDVTYDSYIEDLEYVIDWAHTQDWFQQPFSLCGQSMGAQSTGWYAEQHPGEIKYLAPIAPPVNFDLWVKTMDPEYRKSWEKKGYRIEESRSKAGVAKKIGWGAAESLKKFDLLRGADKLTMPVLFLVGEFDQPCPYENQKVLFDAIPSRNKKFIKIGGAEHSFRNNDTQEYGKELQDAKAALSNWLRDLN